MLRILVADRSRRFADRLVGAFGEEPDLTVATVTTPSRIDLRAGYDVVLIDAEMASGFLAALWLRTPADAAPRVVVLADAGDGPRAEDLMRIGAASWVYRDESAAVLIATVRAAVEGQRTGALPAVGRRDDDAADVAIIPTRAERPVDALLTRREMEILELLERGYGRPEIAHRLHLSPNTVRTHIQRILHRLGVHSTLAAVARVRPELDRAATPAGRAVRERVRVDEGN